MRVTLMHGLLNLDDERVIDDDINANRKLQSMSNRVEKEGDRFVRWVVVRVRFEPNRARVQLNLYKIELRLIELTSNEFERELIF